jgi:hypothetical protein
MKSTINEKGAYLTGLNSEIYEVNMSGVWLSCMVADKIR